jgi:hypothetical protein
LKAVDRQLKRIAQVFGKEEPPEVRDTMITGCGLSITDSEISGRKKKSRKVGSSGWIPYSL